MVPKARPRFRSLLNVILLPFTLRFPVHPRRTLSELKLQHGDILIYQRQLTEQDVAGLPGPVRYPTADAYLSYVHNRRVVRFRRLEEPHGEPAVTLELLKNTTYDEVGMDGGRRWNARLYSRMFDRGA